MRALARGALVALVVGCLAAAVAWVGGPALLSGPASPPPAPAVTWCGDAVLDAPAAAPPPPADATLPTGSDDAGQVAVPGAGGAAQPAGGGRSNAE